MIDNNVLDCKIKITLQNVCHTNALYTAVNKQVYKTLNRKYYPTRMQKQIHIVLLKYNKQD